MNPTERAREVLHIIFDGLPMTERQERNAIAAMVEFASQAGQPAPPSRRTAVAEGRQHHSAARTKAMRDAIRAWLVDRPGAIACDVMRRFDLSPSAAYRHMRAIRAEWLDHG